MNPWSVIGWIALIVIAVIIALLGIWVAIIIFAVVRRVCARLASLKIGPETGQIWADDMNEEIFVTVDLARNSVVYETKHPRYRNSPGSSWSSGCRIAAWREVVAARGMWLAKGRWDK